MVRKVFISALCIITVFWGVEARLKKTLKLDYRQKKTWYYSLNYRSDCVISDKDSISRIHTSVFCKMRARPKGKGDRMIFLIDSVSVESQFYNEDKQKSIENKLTGGSFGVALIDGCPVVDTLKTFAVSEISELDLVIQFAKLLPDIPYRPVRKGYTWENAGVYPIMSNIGEVDCEVYREYRVDSLSEKGSKAYISWRFRYAALTRGQPKSQLLKRVPVSGRGRGRATIDIEGKLIQRALVQFKTPVAEYGDTKVHWLETTLLVHLPPEQQKSGEGENRKMKNKKDRSEDKE